MWSSVMARAVARAPTPATIQQLQRSATYRQLLPVLNTSLFPSCYSPSYSTSSSPALSTRVHPRVDADTLVVTTPIFYVNGDPHIGHLYTAVFADAYARWRDVKGEPTWFVTGTDEHGSKVEQAAKKRGMSPQLFADTVSAEFSRMCHEANISHNDFVRTTEDRHRLAVECMWRRLQESGHITLGRHTGWYCVSDEAYVTEKDTALVTDPDTGKEIRVSLDSGHPVIELAESNYIFPLSEQVTRLTDYLTSTTTTTTTTTTATGSPPRPPVIPKQRLNEVLAMCSSNLPDLSISRPASSVPFAIRVPGDDSQSVYVWLDALVNYMTVCGYPDTSPPYRWLHVIGKDIVKFHALYWPAFLMAAGYKPPEKIVTHAHWTIDGKKMSKSRGTVVSAFDLLQRLGADRARYFLLREGGLIDDGNFSMESCIDRVNTELSDTFGNLTARVTGGKLFEELHTVTASSVLEPEDQVFIDIIHSKRDDVGRHFDSFEYSKAINACMDILRHGNTYVHDTKPWQITDDQRRQQVLYTTLEAVRIAAILLQPVIPQQSQALLRALGVQGYEEDISPLSTAVYGHHKEYLFPDTPPPGPTGGGGPGQGKRRRVTPFHLFNKMQ